MIMSMRTDIPRQVRERDIRLVRFLYCDLSAVVRAKAVHVRHLEDRMRGGLSLSKAALARTVLDHPMALEGLGQIGEVRLVPDPDSFVLLPYADRSAAMCADLVTPENEPWPFCPRSFLKRMLARLQSRGMRIQAAFEGTFTLLTPAGTPLHSGGFHCTEAMNAAAPLVNLLIDALEAQHLYVEQYSAEAGSGQHQLAIRHADGLAAADNQIAFRETVRGVAAAQGLRVSFAPKPFPDQPGNACHLHFSLTATDSRASRFYDADGPYLLSSTGRQFIAGVLEHLPGLMALAAATVNSYRHLATDSVGTMHASWGPDSRLSPIRVTSPLAGDEAATINAELRVADHGANPYMLLGALTAAGLDGITHERSLPHPLLEDPSDLAEPDRVGYGLQALPSDLTSALAALAADEVLAEALGPELLMALLSMKSQEIKTLASFSREDEAKVFTARL